MSLKHRLSFSLRVVLSHGPHLTFPQARPIVERCSHVRVFRTEDLLLDCLAAFMQRLRLQIFPLKREQSDAARGGGGPQLTHALRR